MRKKTTSFLIRTFSSSILMASACFAGLACATKEINKQIDAGIKQEPPVQTAAELSQNIDTVINQTANLTPEQKTKLLQLHKASRTKIQDLNEQSLQLRELLVRSIMDPDYKDEQVKGVKKRLKNVEGQKLAMIFSTIDDANAILGHRSRDNEAVMRAMEIDEWEIHEPSVGHR
jgi:flagellar motility protein MotE (MotC chaperone)